MQEVGRPEAQGVFDREDDGGDDFDAVENGKGRIGEGEGFGEDRQDAREDERQDGPVEDVAGFVAVGGLDDAEEAGFHGGGGGVGAGMMRGTVEGTCNFPRRRV